jgi:multicomponent Na+:H+ antiporter subunit D
MGYVAIGIGLGTETALKASLFYIIAHSIVKPLLFIAAGGLELYAGTTDMDKLAGVLRTEPFIASSFLIGGLAVIGIPPFNMFFAKLSLFEAVFETGSYILLIIMLLGSALAFVGFSRLWYISLTVRSKKALEFKPRVKSIGGETKTILMVAIILVILTGIFYTWINDNILTPAVNMLLSDQSRIEYISRAYNLYKLIGG